MQINEDLASQEKNPANNQKEKVEDPTMPERGDSGFLAVLRKVGFSVWLTVMIIGGALAFIVALFLV